MQNTSELLKLRDAVDETNENPTYYDDRYRKQIQNIYKYCAKAFAWASFFDYNHTRTTKKHSYIVTTSSVVWFFFHLFENV